MAVDDGGQAVAALAASIATANAARKASGTARTGWAFMAGAAAVWALERSRTDGG